jgi:hypothetical protein
MIQSGLKYFSMLSTEWALQLNWQYVYPLIPYTVAIMAKSMCRPTMVRKHSSHQRSSKSATTNSSQSCTTKRRSSKNSTQSALQSQGRRWATTFHGGHLYAAGVSMDMLPIPHHRPCVLPSEPLLSMESPCDTIRRLSVDLRWGGGRESEDHVWFEDRWMVASWCEEWLTTVCGLILG